MVKEFSVALKAVEKKPVTFLALLETGLLNGTRLDKNQVDADSLTVKTLTDSEVETIKVENASLIKGEIKRMPPEKDGKSDPKPKQSQDDSKPAPKPDPSDAKSESDDKTVDKPKPPAAPSDADKPE